MNRDHIKELLHKRCFPTRKSEWEAKVADVKESADSLVKKYVIEFSGPSGTSVRTFNLLFPSEVAHDEKNQQYLLTLLTDWLETDSVNRTHKFRGV